MPSRSLAQAIARTRFYLRFVPSARARQMLVLARINRETASDRSVSEFRDGIVRFLGVAVWPLPSPRMLKTMFTMDPVWSALAPMNEPHLRIWDARPGIAFCMADSLWLNSIAYEYVFRALDTRHVGMCPLAARTDGSQVVVYIVRHHGRPPYSERELQIFGELCRAFAPELDAFHAGIHRPRGATLAEHRTELDAEFRPRELSLYVQALLALFYGRPGCTPEGRPLLPTALVSDLRRYRTEDPGSGVESDGGYFHAFTKNHHGRVLCLTVQSLPGGSTLLTVQEDLAQHQRLHHIALACRALPRDRTFVMHASLVIAEGVQSPAEIARRAGFAHLAPASATRLINQARNIVNAAAG